MSECTHPDPETLNAIYCTKCGAWRLKKEDPVVYCFGPFTVQAIGDGWWSVTKAAPWAGRSFSSKELAIAEARRLAGVG